MRDGSESFWASSFPQAAEVDAGQNQLVAAGGDEARNLLEDCFARQAPGRAASERDYAEGTAISAALLDFEVGPGLGAGRKLRFFNEGVGEVVVGVY